MEPESNPAVKSPPKLNSKSNSTSGSSPKSLPLSLPLPETGGEEGDVELLPIEICGPCDNGGGEDQLSRRKSRWSNLLAAGSGDFSGEKRLRRSPRLSNCITLAAESGGKRKQQQQQHGGSLRRSPRLTLRGKIDNAVSVVAETPAAKSNKDSVKSQSSNCRRLTCKEMSTNVKGLEEKSLVEYQDTNSSHRGRSRSIGESGAVALALKWKDHDLTAPVAIECYKPNLCGDTQLRRSPRFIQAMENVNVEERLGGSNKQRKIVSSQKPIRRSPRFSEVTENSSHRELSKTVDSHEVTASGVKQARGPGKLVQANGNCSANEALKQYADEGHGNDRSADEIFISSSEFREATENVGRCEYSRKLDNRESSGKELKRSISLNETHKNGDSRKFSIKFEAKLSGEMQMSAIVIEHSDSSDEWPAKKIKISVEDIRMSISNEKVSTQAVGTATRQSEVNDEDIMSTFIESSKLTEEKPVRETLVIAPVEEEEKIEESRSFFIGDPIPSEEAQERWCWRYDLKNHRSKRRIHGLDDDDEDKVVWNVECHYSQAKINKCIFGLGDCAYIRGEAEQKHVGKILEFFKTTDGGNYFRVQWFYRAEDTVMKQETAFHDRRRLFYSTVMNDNPIDCIISKVQVSQVSPGAGLKPNFDFYFDMEYCVDYSTFRTLDSNKPSKNHDLSSPHCIQTIPAAPAQRLLESTQNCESDNKELSLLDLYSGCGGMSSGLCLGAKVSGVNLVTRWAVDSDWSACESLKLNHPETHVRNDAAGDFLELLKEWDKLCKRYVFKDEQKTLRSRSMSPTEATSEVSSPSDDDDSESDELEVEKLVDICYGDPSDTGKDGLKFKVHWKGYNSSEDTWEPVEGLSNCQERIQDFVIKGFKSKILPLPGNVDVICGGPPCQGISGYNRFRNVDSPLNDEKNRQIIVFMDIVDFLKPKFVLMENVGDILRLDKGSLGRYALSRLVHMKYQARLGIMAAGCYGLAQFRLRVFLWGANPYEKLPPFPLPTHDVVVRYGCPPEFGRNVVAYDEGQSCELEKALVLQDAISDLPSVTNDENREAISYEKPPETDFQRFIRSTKYEMTGFATKTKGLLYDHRPYKLFEDDYIRVCQIPKRKGANFRDLPGVVIGNNGAVRRDPSKQVLLPSGKPLIPDYAFTFEQGKSRKPFARLWWDETVPTVVTFPNPHNQVSLHPEQDRMLTIREFARFQGFPDYYRFCGTVKQRYCQIGNAVAVSVSRALGYALGRASQRLTEDEPLIKLPPNFSHSNYLQLREITPSIDLV